MSNPDKSTTEDYPMVVTIGSVSKEVKKPTNPLYVPLKYCRPYFKSFIEKCKIHAKGEFANM